MMQIADVYKRQNVVYPFTVVALALALLVGDGSAAFLSLSLGSGDQETSHRSVSYTHLDVYKRQPQRTAGDFFLTIQKPPAVGAYLFPVAIY